MAATAAIAAGIRRAHEQGGLISPTGTPREHRPKKAKEPKHGPPILPNQTDVYEFYHSHKIQVGVAVLIVMNFIFMCAEKEFDPYPTDIQKHKDVWKWGAPPSRRGAHRVARWSRRSPQHRRARTRAWHMR